MVNHGFRRVAADRSSTTPSESPAADDAFVVVVAGSEADAMRHVISQVVKVVERGSVTADPALRRLFPDGYTDDPAAAAELRRFTENALRTEKVAALRRLIDTIPADGGEVVLAGSDARAWLTGLTDVRLVLGTRLNITAEADALDGLDEGPEHAASEESEAKVFLLAVYQYLTFLQESLVQAMSPDSD